MTPRWFTPRTARTILGRVRPEAERIRAIYGELEQRCPRTVGSDARVDGSYYRLLRAYDRAVKRLVGLGLQVRDPRRGGIDFPALRAGRRVWLCWQLGDSSPRFWREGRAGVAERRPVDEDDPWSGDEPAP